MTAAENPYKAAAQERKAQALASVLEGRDPDTVAAMDRPGWDAACQLAHVAWPSEEVRALVVTKLRTREALLARKDAAIAAALPDDPFEGIAP